MNGPQVLKGKISVKQLRTPSKSVKLYLIAMLAVTSVVLFFGCDKSPEAEAAAQASDSVDKAQRLIRSTEQEMAMTESEAERAVDSGENGNKALASQIVNRREKELGIVPADEVVAEITRLVAEAGQSPQDARKLAAALEGSVNELLASFEKDSELSGQSKLDRLAKAEKILKEASSRALASAYNEAKVAPELLLGTISQVRAEYYLRQMHQKEMEIQGLHIDLAMLAGEISREKAVAYAAGTFSTEKSEETVAARLEGDAAGSDASAGLKKRLAAVETKIAEQQKERDGLAAKIKTHDDKARQIHSDYLELLNQADKAQGNKVYELRQQAYSLKSGTLPDGSDGGIYHEAQSELLQSELDVCESRLQYEKIRREQLQKQIASINKTIESLKNNPINETAQEMLQQSKQQQAELLSSLSVKMDALKVAEDTYSALRVQAVADYNNAINSFTKVSRAGNDSRAYGRDLATAIKLKLSNPEYGQPDQAAGLWQKDAEHYRGGAGAMGLLEDIEEVADKANELKTSYEQQALQAEQSAAAAETNAAI